MSPERVQELASRLLPVLRECRSKNESDLSLGRSDHYKPTYGTLSILIAPLYRERMGLPEYNEDDPHNCLTLEECEAVMRAAEPLYYGRLLLQNRSGFESTYEFIRGAWY